LSRIEFATFRPDLGDVKMNRFSVPAALGIAALVLAGCATDSGPKQGLGTLLGGVGGAVAGAQFGSGSGRLVGVAAGTMIGALLGNEVGKSLDRADQVHASRSASSAFEYAPAGQATTWRNPDSGNYGSVTPVRTYRAPSGQYCREYQTSVTVGGRQERGYGTACRQPDGSWEIVS